MRHHLFRARRIVSCRREKERAECPKKWKKCYKKWKYVTRNGMKAALFAKLKNDKSASCGRKSFLIRPMLSKRCLLIVFFDLIKKTNFFKILNPRKNYLLRIFAGYLQNNQSIRFFMTCCVYNRILAPNKFLFISCLMI